MISPYLSSSIVGQDLIEVLEDLFSFVLLYLCHPFPINLLDIRESVDNVAAAEHTLRDVIV